jgi:hypothetical protein
MTKFVISINFAITIICILLRRVQAIAQINNVKFLSLTSSEKLIDEIVAKKENIYCVEGYSHLSPEKWFNRIDIIVEAEEALTIHAVRGIGVDDLNAHSERIMSSLLNYTDITDASSSPFQFSWNPFAIHVDGKRLPNFKHANNFFRDVISSCPSIWTTNKMKCSIGFSTLGTSCVAIKFDKRNVKVQVLAEEDFNKSFIFNLLAGILLIYASNEFSKSKIFQYLFGLTASIIAGALLLSFYIASRAGKSKLSTASVLTFTATYFTGFFWLFVDKLKVLMIKYSPFVIGYIIVSGVFGLISTKVIRGSSTFKRFYRVSVKWFLRMVGFINLYNSTASPLAALFLSFVLILIYFIYEYLKCVQKKKIKK